MADPGSSTPIASPPSRNPALPDVHLLCMEEKFSDAFQDAARIHFPTLHQHTNITVHNCALKSLPRHLRFEAVVSPANSYGRLDGAFDDALAKAYGPNGDYYWLTRAAQKVLYDKWRGFAPPGTCTIVPLEGSMPWETKYLLLCPTMRVPQDVRWDREVVYECVWSMLCAVDEHNRQNTDVGKGIRNILMTPLATGVGRVSPTQWAEQCVLAMKHFVEAVENPTLWSTLEWDKIEKDQEEVACTVPSTFTSLWSR